MSQFWKLVSLPVFLASSVVGCGTEKKASHEGRLDVEVRPDNAAASDRRLEGSFAVRSQDGRIVERRVVVNPYQTLNVALPEGPYRLEWRPAVSFGSEQQAAARARELSAGGTSLSVVAGRVTTVYARAVFTPEADAEPSAPAPDIPSVEILIARH